MPERQRPKTRDRRLVVNFEPETLNLELAFRRAGFELETVFNTTALAQNWPLHLTAGQKRAILPREVVRKQALPVRGLDLGGKAMRQPGLPFSSFKRCESPESGLVLSFSSMSSHRSDPLSHDPAHILFLRLGTWPGRGHPHEKGAAQ